MKESKILTHYLLPTMLQIILISGVAAFFKMVCIIFAVILYRKSAQTSEIAP